MNSSISFNDIALFNSAVTALELDSTPEYDLEDTTLSIYSEDIDGIIDVLHDNEIYQFSCHRGDTDDNEHDQFRNDVEADADALASAGFGTDEDYGYYGDNDE